MALLDVIDLPLGVVTVASYTMPLVWHVPSRGHVAVAAVRINVAGFNHDFLHYLFMLCMLLVQIQLTLTLFRLNILWRIYDLGKCLSINFWEVFATFVSTSAPQMCIAPHSDVEVGKVAAISPGPFFI